jgi:hypothetical protein
MICSKCSKTIKRYNALVYRKKLYCRDCKPEKQEMAEDKTLIVKEKPKEKSKKRTRVRLKDKK